MTAPSVLVGLVVCAVNQAAITTATFDVVTAAGAAPDFYPTSTPWSRSQPTTASTGYYTVRVTPLNGFTASTTLGVAGLPTGVTSSFTAPTVTGAGTSNLQISVPANLTAGSHPFTITGTSGTLAHSVTAALVIDATAGTYPVPWASDDVGYGVSPGSTTFSGSTITVAASGTAIGGTTDLFRYTYQPLVGDGTFIARLTSQDQRVSDTWTGLMIRSTLEWDAPNACMCYAGSAYRFQDRATQGGTTTLTNGATPPAYPFWLKLVRQGNLFTGYGSLDGVAWVQVGTATISMPSKVFVGLALSSASSGVLNAIYDNASLAATADGSPDFYFTVAPSSQTISAGGDLTYYALQVGTLNGFSGTINFAAAGLPSGATAAPATSTGGTSLALAITAGATTPGSYPFTVTGTSGALSHTAGATLVSNTGNATTLPSPWANTDIGPFTTGDGASYANGTFTVTGTGCCLFFSSDRFQFVYQPLSGDGTIVARVAGKSATGFTDADKAGVIIRESLSAGAMHALMGLQSTTGALFQARTASFATPTYTTASISMPYWFKLVRTGSTFTGYASPDAVTWTQVGTATIPMATNVFVGLAVSSERDGVSMTATFDNVTVATAPDYYLTASPPSASANAGANGTYTVNVNPLMGFNSAVTLSASGLPAGATASFSPNPVAGGSGASTLTLSTTVGLAAGSYPFTISGTGGGLTRTAPATLVVKSYSLSASPSSNTVYQSNSITYTVTVTGINGFNSPVSLSVTGCPARTTCSLSPTSVTPTGASTLTVTTQNNTAAGNFTLTINGSGSTPAIAKSTTVALEIFTQPIYSLAVSPASQRVQATNSASYTVSVSRFNGFTGPVTLSLAGVPSGATGALNPTTVPSGSTSSTLTLTTTRSTAVGPSTLTVTGSAVSGRTPTATGTLIVDPPPDFALATSPNSRTVAAGTSATYTVVVLPDNFFNAAVTFAASGLPAGAAASFNPDTVTGAGQTALTVTTTGVAAGSYPFTITGSSGSGADLVTHTSSATLTVGAAADYALSFAPARQFVLQGNSTSFTVTVEPANGFAGPVSFSVTGLPGSGVTASFSPTAVTGSGTTTLTLTAGAAAAVGPYALTITGTSGALSHTAPVALTVVDQDFTVSVSPSVGILIVQTVYGLKASVGAINGFNSQVMLSTSGGPACATTSFSSNPVTVPYSPFFNNLTVNLTNCHTADVGSYTLTVSGTGLNGEVRSGTLAMTLVDYSLSASPTSRTIPKNSSGSYAITVNPVNGFFQSVSFSASGMPTGVTASFSPTQSSAGTTMTLSVAGNAKAGTSTITVTGSPVGGGSTRTTTVTLIIP